jgi:hypothetical protein
MKWDDKTLSFAEYERIFRKRVKVLQLSWDESHLDYYFNRSIQHLISYPQAVQTLAHRNESRYSFFMELKVRNLTIATLGSYYIEKTADKVNGNLITGSLILPEGQVASSHFTAITADKSTRKPHYKNRQQQKKQQHQQPSSSSTSGTSTGNHTGSAHYTVTSNGTLSTNTLLTLAFPVHGTGQTPLQLGYP